MIRYANGPEPPCLAGWRSTPGVAWGAQSADNPSIRASLLRDQSHLCAYCQRRLKNFDPSDPEDALPPENQRMRIEHWHARSAGGAHFAWNNLLGVCSGRSGPDPAEPQTPLPTDHCDRSRGDQALFLHPVEGQGPDPRSLLRYTGKGEVQSEDERATRDIAALKLNC